MLPFLTRAAERVRLLRHFDVRRLVGNRQNRRRVVCAVSRYTDDEEK